MTFAQTDFSGWALLINAVTGLIAGIAAAYAIWAKRASDETKTEVAAVNVKVDRIENQTDGMTTALVDANKKLTLLEGRELGRKEQKAETAERAAGAAEERAAAMPPPAEQPAEVKVINDPNEPLPTRVIK